MIPVSEPCIDGSELTYITDCINNGWISSSGDYINRFEKRWAEYCGRKYGISVSNGTAALQVAIAALGIPKGFEVIIPTFTIISCVLAVLYSGLVPVLVDCDPETLTMDVEQVYQKLTGRTKAIMPVHIYGHPVDIDPIVEIADVVGIKVIEDAAEAHGAEYKGRRCGSFGDLSCFSFYANKIVTTGEGGMVLTDDSFLDGKVRNMINLYLKTETSRFFHDGLGFNYRLTNMQAAIGLAQVERINSILNKKIHIGTTYTKLLSGIKGIRPLGTKDWARPVYWMYGILIEEGIELDAGELSSLLLEKGIQTRPFFLGMHEQPIFKRLNMFVGERYPVSEYASRKGLYLPTGLTLTEEDIQRVCSSLREILSEFY